MNVPMPLVRVNFADAEPSDNKREPSPNRTLKFADELRRH